MSELWVKWKHRLIFGACAWVLLAFIFLCASVDHPLFSSETTAKIYKTISDIILLKWVTKYQTLLAGLAAVVGGVFVLIAAKTTLKEQMTLDRKTKRKDALVACSLVADEFRDIMTSLQQYEFDPISPRNSHDKYFSQTQSYLHILHTVHPQLGSIVSASKRDAIKTIDETNIMNASRRRKRVEASAAAIFFLLLHICNNLSDDGSFDMNRVSFVPSRDLKRYLNDRDINPKILIGLHAFFDWSE